MKQELKDQIREIVCKAVFSFHATPISDGLSEDYKAGYNDMVMAHNIGLVGTASQIGYELEEAVKQVLEEGKA